MFSIYFKDIYKQIPCNVVRGSSANHVGALAAIRSYYFCCQIKLGIRLLWWMLC